MDLELIEMFGRRLREYVESRPLQEVDVIFHGGEPLLMGEAFFDNAVKTIKRAIPSTLDVRFSLQTNGSLLSQSWINCAVRNDIRLSISLDGPRTAQDRHRRFASGESSFDVVMENLRRIQEHPEGARVIDGILAVVDLRNDPDEVFAFHQSLGIGNLDYLWPDGNHCSPPPLLGDYRSDTSYERWSAKVFDRWFRDGGGSPRIRLFNEILTLGFGGVSGTEGIGPGELSTVTIQTNGEIQDSDVFAVAFENAARFDDGFYLSEHSFAELQECADYSVHSRRYRLEGIPPACRACRLGAICSGGFVPHRYTGDGDFSKPSVYCSNIAHLIDHIFGAAKEELERAEREAMLTPPSVGRRCADEVLVNAMNDVDLFVSRWDGALYPEIADEPPGPLPDLVNSTGDLLNPTAVVFCPQDNEFWSSIERGVRPLVEVIVQGLGLITYSSCQGHLLPDGKIRRMNVGIIPRDAIENDWLARFLSEVAAEVNAILAGLSKGAEVRVAERSLDCHPGARAVVDVDFLERGSDYRIDCDVACSVFLLSLECRLKFGSNYDKQFMPPDGVRRAWDRYVKERNRPSRCELEIQVSGAAANGRGLHSSVEKVFCNHVLVECREESTAHRVILDGCYYPDETGSLMAQMSNSRVIVVQNHAWAAIPWLSSLGPIGGPEEAIPPIEIQHFDFHTDLGQPLVAVEGGVLELRDLISGCVGTISVEWLCQAARSGAIGPGSFVLPFLWAVNGARFTHVISQKYRRPDGAIGATGAYSVVPNVELPLGLGDAGLGLFCDGAGSVVLETLELGDAKAPKPGSFWILDIDLDYFDNSYDGCMDTETHKRTRVPEPVFDKRVEDFIGWFMASGRSPDCVTIALSPDFCAHDRRMRIAHRLVGILRESVDS